MTGDAKPSRRRRYWQTSDFWIDAGERIVTAFLEGVTGTIAVDWIVSTVSQGFPTKWWLPPLTGGVMAVFSTIKAIIGAQRKDSTTPVSIL